MAKQINKLTVRGVSSLKKQGRYADGNGLYLQVTRSGSKSWLFRYMLDGVAREMGLGSIKTINLSEARESAIECKKILRRGIDPIQDRNKRMASQKSENTPVLTFKQSTEQYLKAHSAKWKSIRHGEIWHSSIKRFAYPVLGSLPVNQIDRGHVMRVLEPIWLDKTETAKKLRGRIETILDWATVQDYRKGENPARWKGHLDKLLPKPSEIHKVKHFAALPYQEVHNFVDQLKKRDALSALALRLIILTATRSGEVRGAKWSEFSVNDSTWTIPPERMKTKKEHIIPLSSEAVSIINSVPRIAGTEYLFVGHRSGKPLSDVVFKKLMERMGVTGITTHGFRSTFRDWAAEQTSFPREVIEAALAHQIKDKAEAAYFRSNLLEKRRQLMNTWSEYVLRPPLKQAEVIKLKK